MDTYRSTDFTPPGGFTSGIEGPACDPLGNLYAVNFARQHTIGMVTPAGEASVFVELPGGSCGNGIRFNSNGRMFIADYTNHNVLQVDMQTRDISVLAHEPRMNQPNDLAVGPNDILYASDPNWKENWGQIWRIDPDGTTTLLETQMGTTNGIEVSP
ncbi:MAG: SMP-30/gluconolactonase/LRE family protein, partial [Spirochaetales bacterium]|nr:SMP-30/gluconolactonase/LRE family protein [Spirochaetales bacterium]